jgi:hypothetical protein
MKRCNSQTLARNFGSRRARVIDVRFGIIGNTLLEEVGLALQGDHIHEIEWVCHVISLLVAKRDQQPVGNELDILAHEICVHADELDGKGV